jgi:hypothetical protein
VHGPGYVDSPTQLPDSTSTLAPWQDQRRLGQGTRHSPNLLAKTTPLKERSSTDEP